MHINITLKIIIFPWFKFFLTAVPTRTAFRRISSHPYGSDKTVLPCSLGGGWHPLPCPSARYIWKRLRLREGLENSENLANLGRSCYPFGEFPTTFSQFFFAIEVLLVEEVAECRILAPGKLCCKETQSNLLGYSLHLKQNGILFCYEMKHSILAL